MRVLIADDHSIIREGVREILAGADGIQVVAEEADGARALDQIRALRPEVAVLDIEMPKMSGIEVARQVGQEKLPTRVILLSMHKDAFIVQGAVAASVAGYILKEDAPQELLQAIQAVRQGQFYLSPRLTGPIVQGLRRDGGAPAPELTEREQQVVRLLARGLGSKEIAAELGLTPKTVAGYRSRIMDKLNIKSVAQLVKYALRNRLTEIED